MTEMCLVLNVRSVALILEKFMGNSTGKAQSQDQQRFERECAGASKAGTLRCSDSGQGNLDS